jgi:hypothetical protein
MNARNRPKTIVRRLPGMTIRLSTFPAAWFRVTRVATSAARFERDRTTCLANNPPMKMIEADI